MPLDLAVPPAGAESPPPPPAALTFQQAAAELGVSYKTILRLAQEGHIVSYVPPGKTLGGSERGPKGCRIFRKDWEAFLASRRMVGTEEHRTGANPGAAMKGPRPTAGPIAGPDGICRIRKMRTRPGDR